MQRERYSKQWECRYLQRIEIFESDKNGVKKKTENAKRNREKERQKKNRIRECLG